jgi:hypothetical protein
MGTPRHATIIRLLNGSSPTFKVNNCKMDAFHGIITNVCFNV